MLEQEVQMVLIQGSVWKQGSGDKMIKTLITLASQQIRFSLSEDKFYKLKEILWKQLL